MPTSSKDVTELHDLDVHEVSLVDSPAIRRKFLIIKREDANMSDNTAAIEPSEASVEEAAENVTAESAPDQVAKEEAVEAAPAEAEVVAAEEAPTPVEKDAEQAPVIETTIEAAPEPTDGDAPEPVEKAKRMTRQRLDRMYKMYNELGDLLKELAPLQGGAAAPQGAGSGAKVSEPAVQSYPATQIVKGDVEELIKAAITEALAPVAEILKAKKAKPPFLTDEDKEEDEEKGSGKKPAKKAEADAGEPEVVSQEVADLRKKLSVLEATSNAGGDNNTDTVSKNSQPFWSGIL